jgi:hypothetical protein
MRRHLFVTLAVASLLPAAGCTTTLNHLTVDSTSKVLALAVPTANYESDPQLMKDSIPATIKTVEGFLAGEPDNIRLRRILAQLYGEYSFGFIASDLEQAQLDNQPADQVQKLHDRATDLYIRSFGYGLSIAEQLQPGWEDAIYSGNEDQVKAQLDKMDKSDDDNVASVFWMAFGLGQAVDINRDQDYLLLYLPIVRDLFAWVSTANPGFYNGAAWVGLASIDGARPKALGGDPDASKQEFTQGIAVNPDFLMNKVMMAHVYAHGVFDKDLYVKTLTDVLNTNLDAAPQFRLPNTLAKIRAKRYLGETATLF